MTAGGFCECVESQMGPHRLWRHSRKRVAPALCDSPLCELIAVNRERAQLAESFAGEFGARRWHSDWQQLLLDQEIETVYVATPVLIRKDLSGGGPMFDFGCHRIEVLLDIFGCVRDVKATLGNAFFEREVEDVATAVFQFEGGMCGSLTVLMQCENRRILSICFARMVRFTFLF